MKHRQSRHFLSIAILVAVTTLISACGGGSSNSGGGFTIAPGGTIPETTPTTITQSGSYALPNTAFLIDIGVDCPTANIDATATSASTGRTLSENCNSGIATIVDFPSGGGSLVIGFNSGSTITVTVNQAASQRVGNK